MKPKIGSILMLVLSAAMCEQINRRRTTGQSIGDRIKEDKWPLGAQAHIGNEATEGTVVPMIVTAVWSDTCVNGQALLDGNDVYWAISVNIEDSQNGINPGN